MQLTATAAALHNHCAGMHSHWIMQSSQLMQLLLNGACECAAMHATCAASEAGSHVLLACWNTAPAHDMAVHVFFSTWCGTLPGSNAGVIPAATLPAAVKQPVGTAAKMKDFCFLGLPRWHPNFDRVLSAV